MTDWSKDQISGLLSGWVAPAPAADAVTRILAAAGAYHPAAIPPARNGWRKALVAGPAVAAAAALAFILISFHEPLPVNEPALQQSALSVFSIHDQHNEDLP
jgi:hypothetical protein